MFLCFYVFGNAPLPQCYQQFFWYRYFAGIRFNWAVGISVGITSLAGTPFFLQKGGWLYQKGGWCPLFPSKRGPVPPF